MELGFLAVHSDEDHQRSVNIYSYFWLLLTPQHGRYMFGLFWSLSAVLRLLCFFGKAFLKSDKAVALRRSISIILCIILVSLIKVYYEYFCKLMWLWKFDGCFRGITLLTIKLLCKLRILDINMNFIEQNIHVLSNMKSYECHLMKIIKG